MTVRKSLHRRQLGITDGDVTTSRGGVGAGGFDAIPETVLPGAHKNVALFDDFLGDILSDHWVPVDPTDTGSTASAVVSPGTNGFVLITSAGAGGDSGDVAALASELNWKANQGNLGGAIRFRLPNVADVSGFVGMTDSKGAEPPIFEDSGTGAKVSNASDAFGLLFDTQNSQTKFQLVGVAGDTDATPIALDTGPVANRYYTFGWMVDTGGDVRGFLDGISVGKVDNAVTSSVALTPVATVFGHAVAEKTMAVDYVNVWANRDTGT